MTDRSKRWQEREELVTKGGKGRKGGGEGRAAHRFIFFYFFLFSFSLARASMNSNPPECYSVVAFVFVPWS